jgi:hypothetical protein
MGVLSVVASLALAAIGAVLHSASHPPPQAECYTTQLGSTGFCTYSADLNFKA